MASLPTQCESSRLTLQKDGLAMSTGEIAEALLERDASEGDLSQSARVFVGRLLKSTI
jgi:hypothetical protein